MTLSARQSALEATIIALEGIAAKDGLPEVRYFLALAARAATVARGGAIYSSRSPAVVVRGAAARGCAGAAAND